MPKHATSTSWAKGQSGNPAGRPRLTGAERELRDLARAETAASLRKLIELRDAADKQEVQARCAEALLDRGWGKSVQPTEVTVGEELREALQLLQEKLTPEEYGRVLDALASEDSGTGESQTPADEQSAAAA